MQRAVSLVCRRAALKSTKTASLSLCEVARSIHKAPIRSTKIANPAKILSFSPRAFYATQAPNTKQQESTANESAVRSIDELQPALNELKTVCKTPRDLIRALVTLFVQYRVSFGQGTRSAYEDAYTLVFGTLSLPLTEQDESADAVFLEATLAPSEINKVMHAVTNRIVKRVPTAYLIRQAVFGQFSFYVDPRVIIPRSYIAELLTVDDYHQQLTALMKDHEVKTVLDLCTGSGCLAIMAASAFPNAEIYAADISEEALKVARVNVEAYGLSDRVKLVQTDLFANLAGKRFDLIISNPPYVSADRMRSLPLEFRHEPTLALDGGPDGLSLIRRLVIGSRDHMTQNGLLVVETSGHRPSDVAKQFALLQLHWLETSVGSSEVMAIRSVVGQSYEVAKKKDTKAEVKTESASTAGKKSEDETPVETSDRDDKSGTEVRGDKDVRSDRDGKSDRDLRSDRDVRSDRDGKSDRDLRSDRDGRGDRDGKAAYGRQRVVLLDPKQSAEADESYEMPQDMDEMDTRTNVNTLKFRPGSVPNVGGGFRKHGRKNNKYNQYRSKNKSK